jgi:predicted AAA+ superfamily ATPase
MPDETSERDFRSGYVQRVVDAELDRLLAKLPAVLLDGPKAVGKTATALQRAETVHRLDRPGVASVAEADPDVLLAGPRPVLLDEWQRVPALWDAVRTAADNDMSAGQFLLTGSTPAGGMHSGAGRITSIRVRPLTLPERGASPGAISLAGLFDGTAKLSATSDLGLGDYTDLILASGFPGMQHLTGHVLRTQLDGYLERIVDADMIEAGLKVRRPASLMAWLRAYAAATATNTSWERLRDAASGGQDNKPAKTTTLPYIEVLTRLRILDDLPAWVPTRNHLSRLTQGAKHHLADPALAARLVGVTRAQLLAGVGEALTPAGGTFLGQLFESLVTLSVRVFAGPIGARVWHVRDHDGRHEVDLIVERDEDKKVIAFEVKLASSVGDRDVRHLLWLRKQLGHDLLDCAVLTTGPAAYRRRDGVAVIPLGLLGA